MYNGNTLPVPSWEQAENFLKNLKNLTDIQINTLKAIQQYYLYIMDFETHFDIGSLILFKIKDTRPDALLINVFYNPHDPDKGKNNFTEIQGPAILYYLDTMIRSITEVDSVDWPHQVVGGRFEKRCTCHLSKEMNELLGKDIGYALNTNTWNPNIPNMVNHRYKNLDYYYSNSYLPTMGKI
jgi:hypothetical protein